MLLGLYGTSIKLGGVLEQRAIFLIDISSFARYSTGRIWSHFFLYRESSFL